MKILYPDGKEKIVKDVKLDEKTREELEKKYFSPMTQKCTYQGYQFGWGSTTEDEFWGIGV